MADRLSSDFQRLHEAEAKNPKNGNELGNIVEYKIPGGFDVKIKYAEINEEELTSLQESNGNFTIKTKRIVLIEINNQSVIADDVSVYVDNSFDKDALITKKDDKMVMVLQEEPKDLLSLCIFMHESGHLHNDLKTEEAVLETRNIIDESRGEVTKQLEEYFSKFNNKKIGQSERWDYSFQYSRHDFRRFFYMSAVLGMFNKTKEEIEELSKTINAYEKVAFKLEVEANNWMTKKLRELQNEPENPDNKAILDSALNILVSMNQGSLKTGAFEEPINYFTEEFNKVTTNRFEIGSRQKMINTDNRGLLFEKNIMIPKTHLVSSGEEKHLEVDDDEVRSFLTEGRMKMFSQILELDENNELEDYEVIDKLDLSEEENHVFSTAPHRGDIIRFIRKDGSKTVVMIKDDLAAKNSRVGEVFCENKEAKESKLFIDDGELLIFDENEIYGAARLELVRKRWSQEEYKKGKDYLQMVLETIYQGNKNKLL